MLVSEWVYRENSWVVDSWLPCLAQIRQWNIQNWSIFPQRIVKSYDVGNSTINPGVFGKIKPSKG
jgi:hypothetical protein